MSGLVSRFGVAQTIETQVGQRLDDKHTQIGHKRRAASRIQS